MTVTQLAEAPVRAAAAALKAASTTPTHPSHSAPVPSEAPDWTAEFRLPKALPLIDRPATIPAADEVKMHTDPAMWNQCRQVVDFLCTGYRTTALLAESLGADRKDTRAQENPRLDSNERVAAQSRIGETLSPVALGFVGGYPQYLWMAAQVDAFYREEMVVNLTAIRIGGPRAGFDSGEDLLRRSRPSRLAKDLVENISLVGHCTRNLAQRAACVFLLGKLSEDMEIALPAIAELASGYRGKLQLDGRLLETCAADDVVAAANNGHLERLFKASTLAAPGLADVVFDYQVGLASALKNRQSVTEEAA